MGTCEQEQVDHQDDSQKGGSNLEESLLITGPPASRTVIDNLKKLLVQRQHSRESDTENKNANRSNSGSNSDAAFYSQFSTSSSDSDSSDDYLIQEMLAEAGCNNSSNQRRRHRRRRSYSSSSSSSSSPVARSRRKQVTRVNVTLTNSIGGGVAVESIVKQTGGGVQKSQELPSSLEGSQRPEDTKEEHDSANSSSSHKDSSSDDNFPGSAQGNISLSSSAEAAGSLAGGRCPKLKSRRDRDKKRKRSELNYATHRPKLLKLTETTVMSHNKGSSNNTSLDNASATGGGSDSKTSVLFPSTTTAISSNSSNNAFEAVPEQVKACHEVVETVAAEALTSAEVVSSFVSENPVE